MGKLAHGHTRALGGRPTPTYESYKAMRMRCLNANHSDYPHYGGRGISICSRWLDSFVYFLEDMGERPDGMTLGRIDNARGYEPQNCRWETYVQQNNNTRKGNRGKFKKLGLEDVQAIKHALSFSTKRRELAGHFGVSYATITDIALGRTYADI